MYAGTCLIVGGVYSHTAQQMPCNWFLRDLLKCFRTYLPLAFANNTWAYPERCCKTDRNNCPRRFSRLPSRTSTCPCCRKGVPIAVLFTSQQPLVTSSSRRGTLKIVCLEPWEYIAWLYLGVLLAYVSTFVRVTTSAEHIRLFAGHHCGHVPRYFFHAARDVVMCVWMYVLTRSPWQLQSHVLG